MDQTSINTSPRANPSEQLFSERYALRAGYYGPKQARALASEVKRTASVLRKTHKTFDLSLDQAKLNALSVAAQVLERLGEDLTLAASAACKTKKNKIESDRQERAKVADNCALRRWGNSDEAMLLEAKQLAEFIDEEFRSGAHDWLCKRHAVKVTLIYRRPFELGLPLDDLLRIFSKGNPELIVEVRRCAAEYINDLQKSAVSLNRQIFSSWLVGMDDFEAWKARHLD